MTRESDPLTTDYAARFPDAFARILGGSDAAEASRVLLALPQSLRASIAARLPPGRLLALLDAPEHTPAAWLADAPFDDAVHLLSRLRRERRFALIEQLTDQRRKRQLLRHENYPTHTVGWYVRDVQMRIARTAAATDVLDALRKIESKSSPLLVVVDADGRYCGILDPWRILRHTTVSGEAHNFMTVVSPLYPETPVVTAAASDAVLNHDWVPVVDHRRRVLGGVQRATLVRAAAKALPVGGSATHTIGGLIRDMAYVFDSLLSSILAPRRAQ